MLRKLLGFSLFIATACAAGEFSVLTSPPSAIFKGHDHLKASLLPEVFTASLGFTTEQDSNWQGMYISDPFNLGKSVVTVAVDGVADIGQAKGHHFPLKTDQDESDIYDVIVRRIEDHHPTGGSQFVRVELFQGLYGLDGVKLFKGIKDIKPTKPSGGSLSLEIEEDRAFLEEITLLNAIANKVSTLRPKSDFEPDVYWFKVAGLHAVCDLHGENSTAYKEAQHLLQIAIERLNEAFRTYYEGRVLVSVITSDASHTRRVRRAATLDDTKIDFKLLNLSKTYGADYPVIFNIMLWFGVAMFFSLLAICIFIANMDPGRDSIIYRMTSTRMKKDN